MHEQYTNDMAGATMEVRRTAPTVAVVEDDDAQRAANEAVLRRAGYRTCPLATYDEAVWELGRNESMPDLVLLDLDLNGDDGMLILERLRADPRSATVPVIVVTGRRDVETRVRGLDAGANDYVTKPVDFRELVARVDAHLRTGRAWRSSLTSELRPASPGDDIETRRGAVDWIIDHEAFSPVFQPLVDLRSMRILGFEALTRFDDGRRPDLVFHEASSVGRSIELQSATLQVAVARAATLPYGAYLAVNGSADLLVDEERLRSLLPPDRPVVLEITEHEAVEDYSRIRDVVRALGPDVRLAVDDAGAGHASLAHILSLEPHVVKLDRTMIAGIDDDPIREAMVAGLVHFARRAGCALLAEGIERDAELRVLQQLGVELGQGYLLGKPGPAEQYGSRR